MEQKTEMATEMQIKYLHVLITERQKADKTFAPITMYKKYGVEHSNELSRVQASEVIELLKYEETCTYSTHMKPKENTIAEQAPPDKYLALEQKDEQQIMEELEGRVIDEYVYSFPQGGKQVTGLSWAGIKRIAQKMQNITVRIVSIDDTNDSYRVVCEATNTAAHLTMCGVSEQKKFIMTRDDKKLPDNFALQKAMSKAQRNALRNLIPEPIIIEMISEWQKNKNKK